MKINKELTIEVIIDGCNRTLHGLENVGFCVACAQEASQCEPDTRERVCEHCGETTVYGAEELLTLL